jgi:multicomponent Na+:H+ antiporter subunit F
MTLPWLMQTVVLPLLALAVVLTFVRLARGPSLPDRVIAFDLLATLGIAILAAYAAATGQTAFLDVSLLLALVSFLGTIAFAHYLERSKT